MRCLASAWAFKGGFGENTPFRYRVERKGRGGGAAPAAERAASDTSSARVFVLNRRLLLLVYGFTEYRTRVEKRSTSTSETIYHDHLQHLPVIHHHLRFSTPLLEG